MVRATSGLWSAADGRSGRNGLCSDPAARRELWPEGHCGNGLTVHGARCQGRAHLDVPAEDVPGLVERVCQRNEELGLRTLAAHGGTATTGPSFRTWGERLRFAIRPSSDEGSEVEATCRPVVPFVVSDWGRSERILREFLRALHQESLQPQAPLHTAGPPHTP